MSKWKGKLARRIMAIVLSGAMVMSNMSAYAAELAPETETETEVVSEVEETAAAETTADDTKEEIVSDVKEENVETETSVVESSERETDKNDAEEAVTTDVETETSTEETVTTDIETETATEAKTKNASETEESSAEETETESEEKSDTIETKTEETDNKTEPKVLEAKALTAFTAGAKTDGDTETVADYFTIIYSAKSKIDSSSKTWEDGYTSAQRINFGGKAETGKNSIKFTTTSSATVKIWWVQGGDDNRQMVILNSDGTEKTATTGTYTKNSAYYSELTLDSAGTYYLGGKENNNNIYKVEIVEEGTGGNTPPSHNSEPKVLEAKALTAFTAGAKTDGDTETVADYFTIIYSAKSKIDSSSKTWEDGYTSAQRINFGGKAETGKNSIKFTTTSSATVKIWWVQGGDDNRQMVILNSDGTEKTATTGTYTKNSAYYSELTLDSAGTYYLGGKENNNNIYKVEVVEEGTGGNTPPSHSVVWDDVASPEIISADQDKDEDGKLIDSITVTVKADIGEDRGKKVEVILCDEAGKPILNNNANISESATEVSDEKECTVTFKRAKLKGTGTYTFKAVLSRDEGEAHESKAFADMTDKEKEKVTANFVLPLTAPEIEKVSELEDGSYEIALKSVVDEADSYKISVYSNEKLTRLVKELTATNGTETDETGAEKVTPAKAVVESGLMTSGHVYYVVAVAFRGEEVSESSKVYEREIAEQELGVRHIFEANAIEVGDYKNTEWNEETEKSSPAGVEKEKIFTVYYGDKGKISEKSVAWGDGYESDRRVDFGGGTSIDKSTGNLATDAATGGPKIARVIKFEAPADVTVKVWWMTSNAGRQIAIWDETGARVTATTGSHALNEGLKDEFKLEKAGTYYLGNPDGTNYIHKVELVEAAKGASSSIDLSQGLEAGKVYGSEELATLKVLENMPASNIADGKEIGGEKYYYSVQGKNNASPNKGEIPTAGAAFVITAVKDATVSFVTGAADGKAWHVIRESDKKEVAKGPSIPEGEISFRAQAGQTYYFYADGSKVKAYAISLEEYVYTPRDNWEDIDAPEITDVTIKEGEISITVKGVISKKAADSITVEMYDADPEADPEKVVASKITSSQGRTSVVKISPSSSGKYFFKAFLSRNAEESIENEGEEITFDDKESNRYPAEGGIDFHYVLQAPLINAVTNLGAGEDGKGAIEVDWGKTSEATGYEVLVTDKDGNEAGKLVANQETDAEGNVTMEATRIGNVNGLTVDETYKVKVRATRTRTDENGAEVKDESPYSDESEVKITSDKKIKWSFSASGSSTSVGAAKPSDKPKGYQADKIPKNGYHKPEENGNGGKDNDFDVEVWSIAGSGKVVPATTDGLAFYYTELKNDEANPNFELTATAHVESWKYSNGQDGFGLMVSDTVGENGNGDYVWTNCYQNVVSKVEFKWDGTQATDDGATRYSMRLGVGATEKVGATAEDIEKIWSGQQSAPAVWSATQYPLDFSMTHLPAGTYNIVGNCENTPEGSLKELERVDFDLRIVKNNNGYEMSYTNVATGETTTKQFYGTDVLNQIEKDSVYVGVFAGRNADVTFKNVHLETHPATWGPEKTEQETSYINLVPTISSATTTNTSDYDLVFTSNWDGKLEIRDKDMNVVGRADVTGSLDTEKALLKDGDLNKDTKAHVTLSGLEIGSNAFTVIFTPNKKMKNQPAYTELNSYDAVTLSHTVDYRRYGSENSILYVAPTGKSSGTGTKANPLDIYTAIKYVQPGQKIFLAGGRYSLNRTITISRGTNGEPEKMIYMMADPDEKKEKGKDYVRPVFDFNKAVTGMTLGGNYWYFKGFDVTGSLDGQKGIQLSGSHNVLEQVNAYKNGNTGIQVSGSGNDTYNYWPQYNTIRNCTSYLNADHGYEDADGFAAKLTIGSGNIFDGCIAAYNADDGWDLFAKIESGQIGSVTIRNSVAYKNGYVLKNAKGELDLAGEEVDAGNGNGFKMGGDGLPGGSIYDTVDGKEGSKSYFEEYGKYKGHILENSVAFENKSKGFDSNSCPNNKIYNSVSFNNKGGNVELYTYNNIQETDYKLENVISFRTKYTSVIDSVSAKGTQIKDKSAYINDSTYLWSKRPNASINKSSVRVDKTWFKTTVFTGTNTIYKDPNKLLLGRNADGSINMNGFLEVIKENVGISGLEPVVSPDDETLKGDSVETEGDVSAGNGAIVDEDTSGELEDERLEAVNNHKGIWIVQPDEVSYTGQAVKPEVRVYLNGVPFTNFSVSCKNNINAYVEGDEQYSNITNDKRPQMILKMKGAYQGDYIYYFNINPVSLSKDAGKVAAPDIAVDKPSAAKITLSFNGKNLALGKDYGLYKVEKAEDGKEKETQIDNREILSADTLLRAKGIGNYTDSTDIRFIMVDDTSKLKLMSKAQVKLSVNSFLYTGTEVKPEITVDGNSIKVNEEGNYADDLYDIAIVGGTEVGKGSVIVTAKTIVPPAEGETLPEGTTLPTAIYAGSKVVPFTIKKAPIKIENVTIEGVSDLKSVGNSVYTGAARTIPGKITVKVDGQEIKGLSKGSRNINDAGDNVQYKYNYTYEYKSNIEAGSASLIIKGIHNCTGSVSVKFKIDPANVSSAQKYKKAYTVTETSGETSVVKTIPAEKITGKGLEVVYDYVTTYTSSGAKPSISVYYNGNGVSKKNYSVAYKNNRNATSGATAQAIISWKGSLKNCKEKTTLDYEIRPCAFEGNIYAKSVSDVFTNGQNFIKASEFDKSKAVLMNAKTRMANNRDYTLEYRYPKYDSDLKPVMENKEGEAAIQAWDSYDASTKDGSIKKASVYVPESGLDVEVWAKPAPNGNYTGNAVKVAEIRVAYFDIAKAKIQLLEYDKEKEKYVKAVLYFKDMTEVASTNINEAASRNALDNSYVKISHATYAKSSFNTKNEEYLSCTDYITRKGDGYTYDKTSTYTTTAGTQKVTFYGTGLFGGSKVFKYKLEKKTYNITRAIVEKDITITMPASLDAYWQSEADIAAKAEAEAEVKAEAEKAVDKGSIAQKAAEAAKAKNPDENSSEYKAAYEAAYEEEYNKVYDEKYKEADKKYDQFYAVAFAKAYKANMQDDIDEAEAEVAGSLNNVTKAEYEAYLTSVKADADTAAKAAADAAKASETAIKKAEDAAKKVSEDTESSDYKAAYEAVLNGEYDNAYTKSYAETYCKARKDDKVYGGDVFNAQYNQLYSDAKDAVIREGLKGKITVNGTALDTQYIDFDNAVFVNGKCNVEITGIKSYSGVKKITVTVN